MSLSLPITSAALSEHLQCLLNDDQWQELIGLLLVLVPNGTKINIGNTAPAPADREFPWMRLDGDGNIDRIYYYSGGFWLAKHPDFVGKIIMWEGAEVNIPTLDEGEAGAITATTGAFWERVTEMNGKIPIGPGEITPGPPIVNATVNVNAGSYDVELADEHYRHHKHWGVARDTTSSPVGTPSSTEQIADDAGGLASGRDYTLQGTATDARRGLSSYVAGASQTDDNVAFPILPQVRGLWFLRRTARRFYKQAP